MALGRHDPAEPRKAVVSAGVRDKIVVPAGRTERLVAAFGQKPVADIEPGVLTKAELAPRLVGLVPVDGIDRLESIHGNALRIETQPVAAGDADLIVKIDGLTAMVAFENLHHGLAIAAAKIDGRQRPVNGNAVILFQACPIVEESEDGRTPIEKSARSYLPSRSRSKSNSSIAGQVSQSLLAISLSSWPGAQPA